MRFPCICSTDNCSLAKAKWLSLSTCCVKRWQRCWYICTSIEVIDGFGDMGFGSSIKQCSSLLNWWSILPFQVSAEVAWLLPCVSARVVWRVTTGLPIVRRVIRLFIVRRVIRLFIVWRVTARLLLPALAWLLARFLIWNELLACFLFPFASKLLICDKAVLRFVIGIWVLAVLA